MPIKSFLSDLKLSRETLAKSTMEAMERFGDMVALMDPVTDNKVTFRELREESIQAAVKLRSIGVHKGDVVGIILNFKCSHIPLVIGIALCKATTAFFYVNNDTATLSKQLAQVEVTVCIVEDTQRDATRGIKTVMNIDEINAIKVADEDTTALFDTSDVDVMQDPLFLFFTSGSTGIPKIVEFTNFVMSSNVNGMMSVMQQLPGDVLMTVGVSFHGFAVVSTFTYVLSGVQHVITGNLSPENFNQFISKYRVNTIVISNASDLVHIVRKAKRPNKESLQFILTGGVKFPPDLLKEARKKLGVHVSTSYGSTEAGTITAGRSPSTPLDSAGYLIPNVEMKVVDIITGKELGANADGELLVRSPYMMKGYYKQPLETAKVIDKDGWVHTGDFGHYDEKGFIYIMDRIKNIIKIKGGLAIYPTELEAVLLSHPGVVEAAVIKVDHPTYIEAPRAFVVRSDQDLTESDLLSFYNSRVAEFKQLHGGLEFVDEIPKTVIGKPLKGVLAKYREQP